MDWKERKRGLILTDRKLRELIEMCSGLGEKVAVVFIKDGKMVDLQGSDEGVLIATKVKRNEIEEAGECFDCVVEKAKDEGRLNVDSELAVDFNDCVQKLKELSFLKKWDFIMFVVSKHNKVQIL